MSDPTRFQSASEVQVVNENGNILGILPDGSISITNAAKNIVDGGLLFSAACQVTITPSGVEVPFFLLRNPAGSGKNVYPIRFVGMVTATAGQLVLFRARRNPVVTTNGTALTVLNARNGASPPASIALANSLPTVSNSGLLTFSTLAVSGTAGGAPVNIDVPFSSRIDPGYSLLLTGQPDGANRAVEMSVYWIEA